MTSRTVLVTAAAVLALAGCGVSAQDRPVPVTSGSTVTETPSLQTSVCPSDVRASSNDSEPPSTATPIGCAEETAGMSTSTSADTSPSPTPSR